MLVRLAGGDALYVGVGLAVTASIASLLPVGRIARFCLRIANLAGIALVFASATPLPMWTYGSLFVLWLAVPLLQKRRAFLSCALAVILCLFGVSVCFGEWQSSRGAAIPWDRSRPIFVVGDSITAGLHRQEITWPARLAEMHGLRVVNLAEAGATTDTALSQLDGITDADALLLLEIGGNDMLGDTDVDTFTRQLEALLRGARRRSSNIAMFELPLLPLKNGFGHAQRSLAQDYGVRLIPKRVMAEVLGATGATSDGLHLTASGHEAFARSVAHLLRLAPR